MTIKEQEIVVEATAHPRARKFILERDARSGDPVAFSDPAQCAHVPLAAALLVVDGVSEVYFAGNVITITLGRGVVWEELEPRLREIVSERIDAHDPKMTKPEAPRPAATAAGDLAVIDGILEQTIRPYIRSHGGEVELLHYDPETCRLVVNYQGTCGHCPASTTGTLEIIQHILREEFNPRIQLEIA